MTKTVVKKSLGKVIRHPNKLLPKDLAAAKIGVERGWDFKLQIAGFTDRRSNTQPASRSDLESRLADPDWQAIDFGGVLRKVPSPDKRMWFALNFARSDDFDVVERYTFEGHDFPELGAKNRRSAARALAARKRDEQASLNTN